ncbi:CG14118, partial [Drosophila busckii]
PCSFRVNGDVEDPAPLYLLRDAAGKLSYVQPNLEGVVELQPNEVLELHCSGSSSFQAPFAGEHLLHAICQQQQIFMVEGNYYKLSHLLCSKWPEYAVRRTKRSCNGGSNLLEAGFELATEEFLQTYDVCHDEQAEATRYVHHVLYPGSAHYQHSVSRPSFITGGMYGDKDVNEKYKQKTQNITVSEILGMDASPYFDISKNVYLARGHLSAKTDFVFGAAQQATFFFVNVAPQWQTFNAGNWERIEDSVRKFVATENITVDCYTGTWGVSRLPDFEGTPRELYLDFDENNNGLIPVPMLYFRVIIARETREGIVLIGVNNPHASLADIQKDYIICEDIGEELSWISWQKTDLLKGYSYACTVEDFTQVVKDLPLEDLSTSGVLG